MIMEVPVKLVIKVSRTYCQIFAIEIYMSGILWYLFHGPLTSESNTSSHNYATWRQTDESNVSYNSTQ